MVFQERDIWYRKVRIICSDECLRSVETPRRLIDSCLVLKQIWAQHVLCALGIAYSLMSTEAPRRQRPSGAVLSPQRQDSRCSVRPADVDMTGDDGAGEGAIPQSRLPDRGSQGSRSSISCQRRDSGEQMEAVSTSSVTHTQPELAEEFLGWDVHTAGRASVQLGLRGGWNGGSQPGSGQDFIFFPISSPVFWPHSSTPSFFKAPSVAALPGLYLSVSSGWVEDASLPSFQCDKLQGRALIGPVWVTCLSQSQELGAYG